MGIGISSFTEIVGAGPSRHFDILGIKMFDSADIRIHPTGKAMARFGTRSQGQGHETTYAQIIAEELGIPVGDIAVEEGDTDTAPYGSGDLCQPQHSHRRSRRSHRGPEDSETKLEPSPATFSTSARKIWSGSRVDSSCAALQSLSKTIQEIAFAAYTDHPRRAWRPDWRPTLHTILRISPTRSAATSASWTSTRALARSRYAAL